MTNTTNHQPPTVDTFDADVLHPLSSVAVCDEPGCGIIDLARSWAHMARRDAEWHNTNTGHDVGIVTSGHGSTPTVRERLTDDGWADVVDPRVIPDTGSYIGFAVMDDGEVLCVSCVRDRSNPVHVGGDADGWRIDGWDHSGTVDDYPVVCAHCGRVIVDDPE